MIDRALQFFNAGGWVMYPLLVMSILALGIILERALFWIRNSTRKELKSFRKYADLIGDGQLETLAAVSSKDSSALGKLAYWGASRKQVSEESVLGTIELIRPSLDARNALLSVIVGAAPLLGILGTVVGIIESFDLLGAASSVSDPAIVAGGIAEALYTTAAGLTIALVALFPSAYFKSRANSTLSRLETFGMMLAERHSVSDHG
ncbi:MAG: MotA/TolQ/ExbB proton channel family protein [Phycisphaerales bacterium]|nr:MotA/TolQ/ExbB proton channel family protein [Phycisphaerales bacterium]